MLVIRRREEPGTSMHADKLIGTAFVLAFPLLSAQAAIGSKGLSNL